jgi:hypothetical protein
MSTNTRQGHNGGRAALTVTVEPPKTIAVAIDTTATVLIDAIGRQVGLRRKEDKTRLTN